MHQRRLTAGQVTHNALEERDGRSQRAAFLKRVVAFVWITHHFQFRNRPTQRPLLTVHKRICRHKHSLSITARGAFRYRGSTENSRRETQAVSMTQRIPFHNTHTFNIYQTEPGAWPESHTRFDSFHSFSRALKDHHASSLPLCGPASLGQMENPTDLRSTAEEARLRGHGKRGVLEASRC